MAKIQASMRHISIIELNWNEKALDYSNPKQNQKKKLNPNIELCANWKKKNLKTISEIEPYD